MTGIRMNAPRRSLRRGAWKHGRSPGLTAAAMLVLACGIGVATAMSSLVLRGLSRADPAAHPAAVLGVEATGGFTAWTARMIPPARFQGESLDTLLVALLVLALFALAIAVINVTIFLLSAATARRREIAVRAALGASPPRLARQLLAEGGIPAAATAALGFGFGAVGILWLRATWPAALPTWLSVPDPRATLLSVGVPLALTLLVMLAPALATRGKLSGALTTGGRATASRGEGVLQRFLVVVAVAATTLLLTSAGLLVQASAPRSPGDGAGVAAAAGLDPGDVHILHVELLDADGSEHAFGEGAGTASVGDERALLHAALLARVRQLPGVSAASFASPGAVMGLGVRDHDVVDCGRCSVGGLVLPVFATFARHHFVGPGFFDTLGITLESGRDFDDRDAPGSLPVAIVNEAYRASFERGNPVGRQVRVGGFGGGWHTVVGVVREPEVPGIGAGTRAEPALYLAALQHPPGALTLLLRLREADGDTVLPAVRAGIAGTAGVGAVSRASTLSDEMARFTAPLRWFSRVFAALALLSVLLALAALSSVMAHVVRQRRPETGVRLALGATPRRLVLDVIRDGVRLTLIGAALGLLGTTGLVALLQGGFHGVRLFDAHIHGGVVALLILVAVLAGGHPARRAAATQPHVAMRVE